VEEAEFLRSGELARLTGISPDTLRHYERLGVLPRPRRGGNNYRLYPRAALERVRIVRHALSIGFSLAELAKVFRVREQGGIPCRQVKALLEEKLASVDREIEDLQTLKANLRTLLKDWRQRLADAPSGHPARLLETLPSLPEKGKTNGNNVRSRFSRRIRAKRSG
jgi:DNA-binding transcriptional MerR regulator